MRTTGRRSFAWGAALLPIVAAINLTLIFISRNVSAFLVLDLLVMVWLAVVPGVLMIYIAALVRRWEFSWPEVLSIGSALGLGVAPTMFSVLGAWGASQYAAIAVSIVNIVLIFVALLVRVRLRRFFPGFTRAWKVLWVSFIFTAFFLQLYNFAQIHFTPRGDLSAADLFAIDIPYLVGQFSSLKHWGGLRDLHQLAQPMYYHDFVYRFIVTAQQFSKTDLFQLTIYIAPLFSYLLLAISTYALVYPLTHKKLISWLAVAAVFLLGSFISTEQGSFALSPSFVWGTVLFLNLLQLLVKFFWETSPLKKLDASVLIALLLMILSRSKISTFAVLIAGIGILLLNLLVQKRWCELGYLGSAVLVSLIAFAVSSSGKNPFMPGDDFLTGAPLLGYANHLSAILQASIYRLNPIGHGFTFSIRSLLIIPYFLFHLARFVFLDGRMLVVLLAILMFRKKLFEILSTVPRPVLWLLLSLIPLGYFLPVLYSPAWYALAFSFYAPLVSVMSSLILAILILAAIWENRTLKNRTLYLSIGGLCVVGSLVGNTVALSKEKSAEPVIVKSETIDALHFLREHSLPEEVVASRRYDLVRSDTSHDESFFLYSAFSERPVISEGASYGALLGAVATIDSIKGLHRVPIAVATLAERRAALDTIYLSHDAKNVRRALSSKNVKYIIEDKTIDQHLAIDPLMVATPFVDNSAMTIWKVRD